MDRFDREWEVKLRLMEAVTKSQEALARLLDTASDMARLGCGEGDFAEAPSLKEHVRALTAMQGALLQTVAGRSWRPSVRGVPGGPWLADAVCSGSAAASSDSEEDEANNESAGGASI